MRLDTARIRRAAARDCQRAAAAFAKVERQWEDFEQKDIPAYQRWLRATFGPRLATLRELHAQMAAIRAELEELADSQCFEGGSRYEVYLRLRHRREHPEEAEPDPDIPWNRPGAADAAPAGDARTSGAYAAVDDDAPFDESDDDGIGGMADEPGEDAVHKRLLKDLCERLGIPIPPEWRDDGSQQAERQARQERLTACYRRLVRRLHPDAAGGFAAGMADLWHRAQEAYRTGDVECLEMLEAHLDSNAGTVSAGTGVWSLRRSAAELRRGLRAIQSKLRNARREPAWNFRALGMKEIEHRRACLATQSAADERNFRQTLSLLRRELERWTQPPVPRVKPPSRARRRLSPEQEEFDF